MDLERQAIESVLPRLLPADGQWPSRLHRAMRHAVLGGGKRIRPILARLANRAAGGDPESITEAACGLELIHTYSLVHDDLPALDDDVLRRGRPTVHVAFDEPTAILVGDALLTEGLLILARYPAGSEWGPARAEAVALVAEAIGSRGMVGGQMEDLEATGQVAGDGVSGDPGVRLDLIHRHKTGCLLRASVELGALLAGLGVEERGRFVGFGQSLGLAFQVADDVLDATATTAELGKSPGKDAEADKLTWVTLYGLEAARRKLHELETEMIELATDIEGPDGALAAVARKVVRRRG
ncbi:MAG: polyprenyl synthetase family protein [Acidobacteria bacterium]|nr:polyprenyl synthetase family protein [Acidobacteriota bacterium]